MRACGTTAATAPGSFAMFASRLVRRQRLGTRLLGALSLRAVLIGVIPALLAVVGLALYLLSGRYVGTDNAFIGAQKVLITPEVSGKVVSIAVVEGQALRRGDELLSIDPAPYRFAAEEAGAERMESREPRRGGWDSGFEEQIGDAGAHFLGGFVGESDGEDGFGGSAVGDEIGHAESDRAGFAGAGASED